MTREQHRINRELKYALTKAALDPAATMDGLVIRIKEIVRESLPQQLPLRDLKSTYRNDLIDEIKKLWE